MNSFEKLRAINTDISYIGTKPKRNKNKNIGRVDIEKTATLKMPTEKEVAEVIIKIGGGLIEKKHLEKWIKRLKFKENMDLLKNLFV